MENELRKLERKANRDPEAKRKLDDLKKRSRVLTSSIYERLKNVKKPKDFKDEEICKKGFHILLIGSGPDRMVMEWLNILREESGKRIGYGYGGGRYAFYVLEEDLPVVRETIEQCLEGIQKYYLEFHSTDFGDGQKSNPAVQWYDYQQTVDDEEGTRTLILLDSAYVKIKYLKHYFKKAGIETPSDLVMNSWTSFQKSWVGNWIARQYLEKDGMRVSGGKTNKPDFL